MSTSGSSNPSVRTLLLCDLVASTELVERVGDSATADLWARHDRIARDLLALHGGLEIDKSDGFLVLFDRPIEAVTFAIDYQAKLRELARVSNTRLTTRVGIHLGEVTLRRNAPQDVARGAKPVEVEGLAKAIAARVMSLAGDGRVLLTRTAYDLARRAAIGSSPNALHWQSHGSYRLAGISEPLEVCEVAAARDAVLPAPEDTEKASRVRGGALQNPETLDVAPSAEPILAVLAFDNLSLDPEMQFFSDGVSDEIIHRLSRGAKLKVVGKTSSFQFRGERKAEAAACLDCTHVLDGSVRRAASRVRIAAHLVEASSRNTLWSDRFDRSLDDVFAVQDEISEQIANALDQTFSKSSTRAVDPATYDLYLRANPNSYSPDELRASVGLLEVVTERAPHFVEAWGRLAYLRAFAMFYDPYVKRGTTIARVESEVDRTLSLDEQNIDAMTAKLFVIPPFGRFVEADALLQRIRRAPGVGDGRRYVGWYLRTMGHVRESVVESDRVYRLDALEPMAANALALARLAAGRVADAVPIYEDLVARIPDMSFPISSLLRAYAFQENWDAIDRILTTIDRRRLREFEEGLAFIRAKREPSRENIAKWRRELFEYVERSGSVDVSRLVYAAHLGLVDEAFDVAESTRIGPTGSQHDILGPDAYRPSLLFQAGMPELRNDARFPGLCARLGLAEYWSTTGNWPDCVDELPYDLSRACAGLMDVAKDTFWPP